VAQQYEEFMHALQLQRHHRQRAEQQQQCGQCPDQAAAVTERQHIGQRVELMGTHQLGQRLQKDRRQQKGHAHAEIVEQVAVAEMLGEADRPQQRPGTAVNPECEEMDERMSAPGGPARASVRQPRQ
jgi:hypothetical protein